MFKMDGEKAFLGHNWENIRLRIPKGKYRLVMLDFWEHTAKVLGDFGTLEEAREYLHDFTDFEEDEYYIDFVIYNDQGEVVYDAERLSFSAENRIEGKGEIKVPVEEDVAIKISESTNYVAVAIFTDPEGNFEDLLFEEATTLEEAKKAAEKLREKHKDASEVIILDREGNVTV